MRKKLKSWLADDTLYIAVLLVFVGVTSFGLGRLSVGEGGPTASEPVEKVQLLASSTALAPYLSSTTTSLVARNEAAVITAPVPKPALAGPYVGSKSGTKYYLTTCASAKRIKEANKVYFASVNDAKAAGYTPAANCPGL
jgi:hypothetical protein